MQYYCYHVMYRKMHYVMHYVISHEYILHFPVLLSSKQEIKFAMVNIYIYIYIMQKVIKQKERQWKM